MKTYFDKETDKRLLEAQTEEEVKAIIAETPEAEKLADKTDLVMAEIARIKGAVDDELDIDELDSAAGGAKRQDIYLSEAQSCVATFSLEDQIHGHYCYSNDHCGLSNEYKYHYTRYSNCKHGGKHDWSRGSGFVRKEYGSASEGVIIDEKCEGYRCRKCNLFIPDEKLAAERFEC